MQAELVESGQLGWRGLRRRLRRDCTCWSLPWCHAAELWLRSRYS